MKDFPILFPALGNVRSSNTKCKNLTPYPYYHTAPQNEIWNHQIVTLRHQIKEENRLRFIDNIWEHRLCAINNIWEYRLCAINNISEHRLRDISNIWKYWLRAVILALFENFECLCSKRYIFRYFAGSKNLFFAISIILSLNPIKFWRPLTNVPPDIFFALIYYRLF